MFTQIIISTPIWVWALLAGLTVLGYSQTKTRVASFKRLIVLPVVMLVLSANSMAQCFGVVSMVSAIWLLMLMVVAKGTSTSSHFAKSSRYIANQDSFEVRGSWLPMLLILSIFIGKYAVSILTHIEPSLAQNNSFGIACALYFASLNGLFLGRALSYVIQRKTQTSAIDAVVA